MTESAGDIMLGGLGTGQQYKQEKMLMMVISRFGLQRPVVISPE